MVLTDFRIKVFFALLIMFMANSHFCYPQSDSVKLIEVFSKKNIVQPYIGTYKRSLQFKTNEINGEMYNLLFSPNSAPFAGVSFNYKKLNVYIETSIPNTQLVDKKATDVRSTALFVHHFSKKFGVTGFINWNKGLLMYMPDAERYGDRNDLRMFTIGAHFYSIFNGEHFSYSAANSLTKLQTKSKGSFMLMTTPVYRKLYSTESIIPTPLRQFHLNGSQESSKSLQFISLQFRPGYTYNFVFKNGKYFIAPAAYAGAGVEFHNFKTYSQLHTGFNLSTSYRIKMVTGINSNNFFLSFEYLRDSNTTYLYKTNIKNTYTEMSCNLGLRF